MDRVLTIGTTSAFAVLSYEIEGHRPIRASTPSHRLEIRALRLFPYRRVFWAQLTAPMVSSDGLARRAMHGAQGF